MKKKRERDREQAIQCYLQGDSITTIAKKLGYTRPWVYKWIERHQAHQEHWQEDQSRAPRNNSRQLPDEVTAAVKLVRLHLYQQGLFCGAQAISWELEALQVAPLPSLRSINRIVQREGLRQRRTGGYQPKGKRYPQLSGKAANEVHQSDYVGPCYAWAAALLQYQ